VKRTIEPSAIGGILAAPASKSVMQRACAMALLHAGITRISNPGKSEDDKAAIDIIQQLGARVVELEGSELEIRSYGFQSTQENKVTINCGESGLSVRMFTPIAALSESTITLTGRGSLMNRPMHFFESVLPQLGVSVKTNDGHLPLTVKGPLDPTNIEIDGSLSSQFLTGLLIAMAKKTTTQTIIQVSGLVSRPYIDLTLQMMDVFGYRLTHEGYQRFIVEPKGEADPVIQFSVEGDWSSAAFLLVAAAINGSITIKGLDPHSTQADKAILQLLMQAGVPVSISEEEIVVSNSFNRNIRAFQFDASDCPDLFPPAVALAAYAHGTSVIQGVHRLTHKESNRAQSLMEEFGRMGIVIAIQDDLMRVTGGQPKGAELDAHGDHRIAMACAVAALGAVGPSTISGSDAVAKSYPGFYDDLKMLGVGVSLI